MSRWLAWEPDDITFEQVAIPVFVVKARQSSSRGWQTIPRCTINQLLPGLRRAAHIICLWPPTTYKGDISHIAELPCYMIYPTVGAFHLMAFHVTKHFVYIAILYVQYLALLCYEMSSWDASGTAFLPTVWPSTFILSVFRNSGPTTRWMISAS